MRLDIENITQMPNWKIRKRIKIKNESDYPFHPIALNIFFQRDISTSKKINSFLFPDYEKDIHSPFLFSQMPKIVKRIKKAMKKKEKVVIFGDYDADGVTSTVVLAEAFRKLKISCDTYIPDKKSEGYGLNLKAIEKFKKQNVNLIITVDCGISNFREIEKANELGIDVIVTDHHHIPSKIPKAHAIINAHMDDGYPFKDLAGVGAAFKLAQALYEKIIPEEKEQLKWLLDLVAIGTIADCVPLTKENRTLCKYGLVVLSKTRRTGLQELFKVGGILADENNIPDAHKVSFQIAPRINAAGRMNHASIAYNLISEKDRIKARGVALELEDCNKKRQTATKRIVEEVEVLANNAFQDKKFIFAAEKHFPIGIVGLAAGKITDKFKKPSAVLQKGKNESRGSFRSIPRINIIEVIEKCDDLLIKYGGHSQAAGIVIKNKNLERFYEKLNALIEKKLKNKDIAPKILIDAEISSEDIGFKLTEDIKKMEPFGKGNEEPIFLTKNLIVEELKWVGNGEKHLKLFLRPNNKTPKIFEAIGFNLADEFKNIKQGDVVDLVFNLQQDSWNGNKKIQLNIVDLKIM